MRWRSSIGTRPHGSSSRVSDARRSAPDGDRPRGLRAACASSLALLFGGLLWWSWVRWPDVLVDFGRELYVAWRLADGAVPYRDVMYINGPLSPFVNALWFRMFGVGLRTLVLANAAITVVVVLLLWRLLERMGGAVSATLACAVFLVVFAFAQQMPTGNYNFIAPYSHEMTHGMVIGLVAVLCVGRLVRSGTSRAAAACGACLGLALLTKPEVVLATTAATVGGGALALVVRRTPIRTAAERVAVFCAAAALPPLVAGTLLSLAMPPREAFVNTMGGLRWLGDSALASRFYLRLSGMLDPYGAATRIVGWSAAWSALLGAAVLVGRLLPRGPAGWIAAPATFAAVAAAAWAYGDRVPWSQALLPLPIVAASGVLVFGGAALRSSTDDDRERLVVAAALSLLSLVLLAKILLRVRAIHYGFALAMPATMLAIVLAWEWLPRLTARTRPARATVRAAFLAALCAFVIADVRTTIGFHRAVNVPVGRGVDAFRADARGHEVARVLDQIAAVVPANATVAVMPAGAMIGYLSRRPSSIRYVDFDPFVVALYGEREMLDALVARPPDFIVLADVPMVEYGPRGFGDGYAEELASWIGRHYEPVGAPTGRWIVLLQRTRGRGLTPAAAAP